MLSKIGGLRRELMALRQAIALFLPLKYQCVDTYLPVYPPTYLSSRFTKDVENVSLVNKIKL